MSVDEAEAEKVTETRRSRFAELGFEPRPALALALSQADWHDVARALEHGCSHELAVAIFV